MISTSIPKSLSLLAATGIGGSNMALDTKSAKSGLLMYAPLNTLFGVHK